MQKIKDATKRISALAGAMAMLLGIGTSMFPISVVSADALNPLTERSLSLTSSSPGFHFLDASGNSRYAPAGSGNNGQKTGELFTFKVSSAATIHAFTVQYCTQPAGLCLAPGNDAPITGTYSGHDVDTGDGIGTGTSDFNVNFPLPSQGTVNPDPVDADGIPTAHSSTNNFQLFVNGTPKTGTATAANDWNLGASNKEDKTGTYATQYTNKNNYITLTSTTGITATAGEEISLQFYGTDTNYITNPGLGAYFAKINTYSTFAGTGPYTVSSSDIIDGGVTVANVMNDSIQIQTKVLETMYFSVGTVNPEVTLSGSHGTCDPIATNAAINLGDPNSEYSLRTTKTYDGYSYWRLSSNSSNGATVYYSGYTLHNTENDHIKSMYFLGGGTWDPDGAGPLPTGPYAEGDGSAAISLHGTEQFGLGVEEPTANDTDGVKADLSQQDVADTAHGSVGLGALNPLIPLTAYAGGAGTINSDPAVTPNTALFAFKDTSLTTPEAIATEPDSVVHCSTARMRYVANIAPDTPAGIYTSKINYIASPEY